MNGFPSQAASVRRTDLRLRAAYPYLKTRIFEVTPHGYNIVFDEALLKADTIQAEFHMRIREATLQVQLSNELPSAYLQEIPPLPDSDVSKDFAGIPLNIGDLRTILLGKLPDIPPLKLIGHAKHPTLTFFFENDLSEEQRERVRNFMDRQMPGWPIEFETHALAADHPVSSVGIAGEILEIRPSRLRPSAPPWVKEDEAFWFRNLDKIFEGSVSPGDLLNLPEGEMSCYIDASGFEQLDLRQALLCYDTIYLSPPLNEGSESAFWDRQALTKTDLLDLASAHRLKVILRQPEERTDPDFLAAVFERDPQAIIGRRKASALVAAEICKMGDEYIFAKDELVSRVPQLAEALAAVIDAPETEIVQTLLWPVAARRSCLMPLNVTGLMSVASFGPGKLLGEQISRVTGRDLRLEALMTTDQVLIAHTLNATYIPPLQDVKGWILPRRMVGDRLNFYRSFNTRIAADWAVTEHRREETIRVLPAIPILEFNRHAPLGDLLAITAYPSIRRKARALIGRLSEMSPEAREEEKERLLAELYRIDASRTRRQMFLDTADAVQDVAAALMELGLFPFTSSWKLLRAIVRAARRIPSLDRIADDLEQELMPRCSEKSDLNFLSTLERVAQLKPKRGAP